MKTPLRWMQEHKPHNIARFVMPYLVALLTLATVFSGATALRSQKLSQETQQLSHETHHTAVVAKQLARSLQVGIIESCNKNGNTLRELLRERTRKEISSPQKVAEFETLFPEIPPAKLQALVHKSNREKRQEVRRLAPVDCPQQYRDRFNHTP